MDLKKLDDLEFIENKLMEIREIIKLEDAYQVCDAIITSINDELLESHISAMLRAMGYEKATMNKVRQIIRQIQSK